MKKPSDILSEGFFIIFMIIFLEIWQAIIMKFVKEVYQLDNKRVYKQWNGKNIDGQVEVNNNFLSNAATKNNTSEMKYIVGVDTFSADELQQDIEY